MSRSIFALVDDRDRAYFGRDARDQDQIGYIDANTRAIFGRSYAAEPDKLVKQLAADGTVAADLTSRLASRFVGAVAADPLDQSIWVGNRFGGAADRLQGASTTHYALDVFGSLANSGIEDIQMARQIGQPATSRKVLVGFRQGSTTAGFVAVYSGN